MSCCSSSRFLLCGKTGILSPLCYESDLKVDGEPRLQIRRPISNKKKDAHKGHLSSCCGKTGIRTLEPRKGLTVFETAPFDHSGIFPMVVICF